MTKKNKIHEQKFTMTQKVEDMAAEFLLTFLAVLVQLGLPAKQNQISGKDFESGYAIYRSVIMIFVEWTSLVCWVYRSCLISLSLSYASKLGLMIEIVYCHFHFLMLRSLLSLSLF